MTGVWIGFVVFVLLMVALDLGVLHRERREITIPEALAWTGFWVALALTFNGFVYFLYEHNWFGWSDLEQLSGKDAALEFLTGFVLEKSLSVDNIFVIAMVFAYFRVPLADQHRVLFWGILGAVVLRGLMIGFGAALIHRFDWIVYVFGGLLLISAARMMALRHDNVEPNAVVQLARRLLPVTENFHGGRFFVVIDGVRHATPLFLCLLLVETSDVMFAIDSIPAIFAVTQDPFLVFTSNVFAVLGLRSLYFALAGMMERFRFLKISLVFLLAYIGVKMILTHHFPIPTGVSLAIIAGILSVGVLASLLDGHRDTARLLSPLLDERERLSLSSPLQARRVVMLVVGGTLLLAGVAMLFLPGPGLVTVAVGLIVIGSQFAWARRWLRRLKSGQDA